MERLIGVIALVLLALAARRGLHWLLGQPFLYEGAIRAFEGQPLKPGSAVFLGSSSINFWSSLVADFAPLPVLNRGFGGAVTSQVNHFLPRLLPPGLAPRALVFYCGDNDLAWSRSVDRVEADVARFLDLARELASGVPIHLLSVKLSPQRWLLRGRFRELNRRLAALAQARPGVHFLDVATPMLDSAGRPRRELYGFDGLHLSPKGYALWTSLLKPLLERDLSPGPSPVGGGER